MKQYLLLTFTFMASIAFCQSSSISSDSYAAAEKMLSWNTGQLVDRSFVNPTWLPDNKIYYRVLVEDAREYVLYDIQTRSKDIGKSRSEVLKGKNPSTMRKPVKYTEVLSPDGQKVVFIKDWNLWMRNLESGEEKQLTTDGIENFGYATDNAGWRQSEKPIVLWSPDSKKLATFQQDQRHVSDMYLVSTNVGEPRLKAWKYPLPEDKDIIRIHRVVIDVESGEMVRLKIPPDPRRGTLCDDISCTGAFDDNEWSPDSKKLAFVSTSRDHKVAQLRVADVESGEVRDVYKEEVETQYESGQGGINWHVLWDKDEFVWYSERSDWGHLYLYDLKNGGMKHQITNGEYVVLEVLHWDEENRKAYFMANGREEGRDPYFSHFYQVDMDTRKLTLLTPENANHRISMSPDHNYFIDNFSTPTIPNTAILRKMNGEVVSILEKADVSRLMAMGWQPPTPITVKSADGKWDLYGLMYTPTHLNKEKKYPIVNYIYPGPQGGGVGTRSFSVGRKDHQALAELGFVVVSIDGTCNPGRSKSFHDACYGDMSVNTLPDQVAGMQQLAEEYPFIDLDRVGIWGHSGGGFATAAALFKYPEFFDVGISESGNHDNRNYEDDWGERYNGLVVGDNYKVQANQLYAENLQGKLLLAHGGMDDNVPPYNTQLVVDALIKANKDFDLIIFPNARHGFGADSAYMMRRRWDYFVEHLQGKKPPKEYKIQYQKDPRLIKP